MLKELVQYLEKRPEPKIVEHNGQKFSDKPLELLPKEFKPQYPVKMGGSYLSSIVTYITGNIDNARKDIVGAKRLIVHVESPTSVSLFTEALESGVRWNIFSSVAEISPPELNKYYELDYFNVMLQTAFIKDENRGIVTAFCSRITDGVVKNADDDGISQQVTVKSGIQRVENSVVPNPVELVPYRTFSDIANPSALYVLRLQPSTCVGMPKAGLFEVKDYSWKLVAIDRICAYFSEKLAKEIEDDKVVILA